MPCPGFIYTIQPGDTFYLIALRYGTTVDALIRANPGVDPNRLFVGQRICVPVVAPPGIYQPRVAVAYMFVAAAEVAALGAARRELALRGPREVVRQFCA